LGGNPSRPAQRSLNKKKVGAAVLVNMKLFLQLSACLSLLHQIRGFAPGCMQSLKIKESAMQHRAHSEHAQQQQQTQSLQTLATSLFAAVALVFAPLNADALPQKPPESNAQVILLEALPRPQTDSIQALGAELGKMTSEGSGNIRSVDQKGMKGVRGWDTVLRQVRVTASALIFHMHYIPCFAPFISQCHAAISLVRASLTIRTLRFLCVFAMIRSEQ
jgi:hypothetical protein